MKNLITLTICILFFSCKKNQSDFNPIGKEYQNRDFLIKNIVPNNKEIKYWKYIKTSSNKPIQEKGDSKLLEKYKIEIPENGFFPECMPGYCFSYIIYIDENGVHYITNNNDLIKFLGNIDNLSEALLIGKTQGYWFDQNNPKGGSYKKIQDGYELYLLDWNGCPLTYQSIFFKINKKGDFKVIPKEIYKQTSDCTVS